MFGYTFKVIKINKDTKEVEIILENEEFVMIAKDVANKANNTKAKNEEVKLLNYKDEEIDYKPTKKVYNRDYRTNTRIVGTKIKMY